MANALYGKGRQAFLDGNADWMSGEIKAVLVDTAVYTVSIDVDEFYSDLSGIVGVPSDAFTSKTSTLGIADAADISFAGISGESAEAIVVYQNTGTPATSRLLAYIDTGTGLPVTPNSGDINVTWDDNANKIFKL